MLRNYTVVLVYKKLIIHKIVMNISSINQFFRTLLHICVACVAISSCAAYSAQPVKIGVLAFRPKPQTLAQWQPLATALKQALPEHDFEVQALTFPELEKATENKQLDFVLTNPAHYILLTKRYGLSAPLATLATHENGQRATMFGVSSLRAPNLMTSIT